MKNSATEKSFTKFEEKELLSLCEMAKIKGGDGEEFKNLPV